MVQRNFTWSLDGETCSRVLEALLADRFLARTSTGSYRQFDSVSFLTILPTGRRSRLARLRSRPHRGPYHKSG